MRPYVLHEYSFSTLPSGEPITGGGADALDVLPAGTVVSLVLESRDRVKTKEWRTWDTGVRIEDAALIRDLPAQTRSEELFFRTVKYLPKPRDRYVVERIAESAYIYAPLSELEGAGTNVRPSTGAEVSLQLSSAELRNKYFPIDSDDLLYDARKPLWATRRKLHRGEISQEQFDAAQAPLKKAYADLKDRLRKERDAKYPIGDSTKVRIEAYEEASLHSESAFLQGGDQITCKRKNVHFVGDPRIRLESQETARPWCVTTWDGTLLHPSIRDLVGRGHLVRAACTFNLSAGPHTTIKYFSIVDVLSNGYLMGVLRGYYISGWDEESLGLIGKYFVFHRDAISEIPHMWTENKSLEKPAEKSKQPKGLAITGITALGDWK